MKTGLPGGAAAKASALSMLRSRFDSQSGNLQNKDNWNSGSKAGCLCKSLSSNTGGVICHRLCIFSKLRPQDFSCC